MNMERSYMNIMYIIMYMDQISGDSVQPGRWDRHLDPSTAEIYPSRATGGLGVLSLDINLNGKT